MSAPWIHLCGGDRPLRDKTRLYMDRVRLWGSKGNSRDLQEINAGIPALCASLANEALGRAIVSERDMRRASGLSPAKYNQARALLRSVVEVSPVRQTRSQGRASAKPSSPSPTKPRLDRASLLERAKAVQSGELFQSSPPVQHAVVEAEPQEVTAPRKLEPTDPAVIKRKHTQPKSEEMQERHTQAEPAQASEVDDPIYKRMLSLGVPMHREGLKFELEPSRPRKRGRPPAAKKVEQPRMSDVFGAVWDEEEQVRQHTSCLPARYLTLSLSRAEEQWLSPLPSPLVMSTLDPGAPNARPSAVLAGWKEQLRL